MDGSCGSRWPGTEDPLIPTTVVVVAVAAAAVVEDGEVEEGRPGDTAGMDAEAGARDTEDGADPAAGAALDPEADPATANPGPGPTPDPSPTLPGPRRPRPSPSLVPDLDPGPGPSPGPEAAPPPPPPKESPGRDLKASPSRQQKMEANPLRAQQFQVTSELQVQDWIRRKQPCPAVKGYYCVFHALVCFIHFAANRLFFFPHFINVL